jgi:hypothetical protein
MATSDFWQRVSASVSSSLEGVGGFEGGSARTSRGATKLWMVMDAVTALVAATVATIYRLHDGFVDASRKFWHCSFIRQPG